MIRIGLISILSFSFFICSSQTFEAGRTTTWENAGNSVEIEAPEFQVNITGLGADNTGITNSDAAYLAAIDSLNGTAGTIYFPQGSYLFNSTLSVPDSVFLVGESSEALLQFDLGGVGHLILMLGDISSTELTFANDALKGSYTIDLVDASSLQVGDVVRLYQFDEDFMFSSWAYGTLGQVIRIEEVVGNTITLADPLNHDYPLSRTPYLTELEARTAAGVECLTIERLDATVDATANINIRNAFNCAIRNVESNNCNRAHLQVGSSAHIKVEGCYFHHAFAYGSGGQGYGLVFQTASSFCLGQNNVFEHLRHSMLIQSGANGNVFGYNYSTVPFWDEGIFPSNSAGDAVLHGNYPYLNLFEGNTVQNIIVDASHDKNGPFNTFFRNRAELYGFVSDNSTPTDSMNVVGNEITAAEFPLGNFSLNGLGHYSYGNNVFGTVTPTNTTNVNTNTLYLNENDLPFFLGGQTLPMVGYPLEMNDKVLYAQARFDLGIPMNCTMQGVPVAGVPIQESNPLLQLWGNQLRIDSSLLPATINIYSIDGRMLSNRSSNVGLIQLSSTDNKLILIQVIGPNGEMQNLKSML